MSCELRVELDRTRPIYHPGDVVSGRVVVNTSGRVQCNQLTVAAVWSCGGEGEQDERAPLKLSLFQGFWDLDSNEAYPFSFTMPAGPYSYRGESLNLYWNIKASAEIPSAGNPAASAPIILRPGKWPPRNETDGDHLPSVGATESGAGCLSVIGIIGVIIGLIDLPFTLFFMLPGLLFLGLGTSQSLSERKLGKVSVEFSTWTPRAGSELFGRIKLNPRKTFEINGITATLVATECSSKGTGKQKENLTTELYREERIAAGPQTLHAGPLLLNIRFELPDTTAYSFEAEQNQLKWSIKVDVDVPGWPDWEETHQLILLPRFDESEQPDEEWPKIDLDESPVPFEADDEIELADDSDDAVELLIEELDLVPEPTRADTAAPEAEVAVDASASVVAETPSIPEPLPQTPTVPDEEPEAPTDDNQVLHDAAMKLKQFDSWSDERQPLLDRLVAESYRVKLKVDHVDWTFNTELPDELQSGRTVVGTLSATDTAQEVAICFPQAQNARIDALKCGTDLEITARLLRWDELYRRPILGASSDNTISERRNET